jgi:hypothetical protein
MLSVTSPSTLVLFTYETRRADDEAVFIALAGEFFTFEPVDSPLLA